MTTATPPDMARVTHLTDGEVRAAMLIDQATVRPIDAIRAWIEQAERGRRKAVPDTPDNDGPRLLS